MGKRVVNQYHSKRCPLVAFLANAMTLQHAARWYRKLFFILSGVFLCYVQKSTFFSFMAQCKITGTRSSAYDI